MKILNEKLHNKPITKPAVPEVKLNLLSFAAKFIEECKSTKAIQTIKSYVSTLNHLETYSKLHSFSFEFDGINPEWRNSFIKYLQNQGLGKNTEGKHIKIVKIFMNEATERNLNSNLSFRSKSFSKPHEDVHKIFVTMEEIGKLASVDLKDDKLKDIVRDYFIISCLTSLRYSDFVNIRPEHIKENTIQMTTQKTSEPVIIPIASLVRKVFEKYNYILPKAPCNQVFNRTLKEVGKLAELNEITTISKTIGGVKQKQAYKKYQLLTSHTGRRSMISNCIIEGIPTPSIMLISAHKNLKVFQGYVRLNQMQNAEVLAKHDFFN